MTGQLPAGKSVPLPAMREAVVGSEPVGLCAVQPPAPLELIAARPVTAILFPLLVFNILLQVFDGVATYTGLQLGIREGNPLLREAFAFWGLGAGLVLIKGYACGLLLGLYRLASEQLAVVAFGVLAGVYTLCSLVPWLGTLAGIVSHVL